MEKEIQLLFRGTIEDKLNELRKQGKKIYSISRVNNYHTCPRQYYYTYTDKKQQKPGVYGILGTACHSDLELLYTTEETELKPINFTQDWCKSEMFGIKFPSDKIKENYKKDIDTFYKYYNKREGEFICELGFILKLDEEHYLTGFIDLLQIREDGKVNIFDFKTSAMFKDKKLIESGRQLTIYEMALEQLYGLKTEINGWEMLKYLEIQVGDCKPKVVSAREWVEKCESQLRSLMKNQGINPLLIDMMLSQAVANNNIDGLPKEIQDMVKINTYFMSYNVTEEVKQETLNYILTTIRKIESLDRDDITQWQPNPNKFFCDNLCGFGGNECDY